jgi:hypothetical protein
MDTIERPALVISVAVIVSEGHAQAASTPEPAVLESTGEAPCTKVTAAEVPATHGAAEVSAAKTSAEMASTHAPAAMAPPPRATASVAIAALPNVTTTTAIAILRNMVFPMAATFYSR